MIYVGIDPGKKGAYALLRSGRAEVYPWDDDAFVSQMDKLSYRSYDCFVVLEHVSAMPKQGLSSTFLFGQEFGFIQGVLRAFNLPYELVRPQKWKKEFSVTADKNTSIEVCKKLFPAVSLFPAERCRKPSDGMAEALLMAEYARRRYPQG